MNVLKSSITVLNMFCYGSICVRLLSDLRPFRVWKLSGTRQIECKISNVILY